MDRELTSRVCSISIGTVARYGQGYIPERLRDICVHTAKTGKNRQAEKAHRIGLIACAMTTHDGSDRPHL